MHQPRPYGLHVEGGELTGNDTAFIDNIAKRLTNYIQLSGVSSLKWQYDLPDGGTVLIQDMGGTFRVMAQKPEIKTVNAVTKPEKPYYIPMLFSGVITSTPTDKNNPTELRLTEQCRKRLTGYKDAYAQTDVSLHRFTIAGSQTTSAKFVSQYESEYPTWFSGAMAEFVQVVAGYGRQDFDNLPDDALEQAQMNIPAEIYSKIVDELAVKGISITDTLTHQTGRIYYAYNFYETNAIGFASDNRPWLLNIASNGVWAMPLPMIPETTTQAFKDYIISVGDTEILTILDRFGGMPSGAGFPQGDDFQTLVKAGVIIRVCDTANYSKNNPYSPYLGWSVNTKASDGFLTCYNYDEDTLLTVGYTYRMQLNLALINQIQMPTDDPYLNQVKAYVTRVLSQLSNDTLQNKALRLKLARADYALLKQRALKSYSEDTEIDYWHDYQSPPIANHTGNVYLYSQGFLYSYYRGSLAPEFKFPTIWPENGCSSFNFFHKDGYYFGESPKCDTTMFVYFVGDTAKRVNYFVNYDVVNKHSEANGSVYEAPKPATLKEYESGAVYGYFYTTDIDEREFIWLTSKETSYHYDELGYDQAQRFSVSYNPDGGEVTGGIIWRYRYLAEHEIQEKIYKSPHNIAICVPFFNRNMVAHAKKVPSPNAYLYKSTRGLGIIDPNQYFFEPVNKNLTITTRRYAPAEYKRNEAGRVILDANGNPVPTARALWADSGDWSPVVPDIANLAPANNGSNIAFYRMGLTYGNDPWYGGAAPIVPSNYEATNPDIPASGSLKISAYDMPKTLYNQIPNDAYFKPAWGYVGESFKCQSSKIVFGKSNYLSLCEYTDEGSNTAIGNTKLIKPGDEIKPFYFIGVINE